VRVRLPLQAQNKPINTTVLIGFFII